MSARETANLITVGTICKITKLNQETLTKTTIKDGRYRLNTDLIIAYMYDGLNGVVHISVKSVKILLLCRLSSSLVGYELEGPRVGS